MTFPQSVSERKAKPEDDSEDIRDADSLAAENAASFWLVGENFGSGSRQCSAKNCQKLAIVFADDGKAYCEDHLPAE